MKNIFIILALMVSALSSYGEVITIMPRGMTELSEQIVFATTYGADESVPAHTKLQKLGIITGDAEGNLLLDNTITRAEMTLILIRIMGMEEEAKQNSQEAGYADRMAIPDWAKPFVAYAKSKGIMTGDEFGVFNAMGKISGEEFASMFRRVLGYDSPAEWTKNISVFHSETGISVPEKEVLTRKEVFDVLWDVFSKNVKKDGSSLLKSYK